VYRPRSRKRPSIFVKQLVIFYKPTDNRLEYSQGTTTVSQQVLQTRLYQFGNRSMCFCNILCVRLRVSVDAYWMFVTCFWGPAQVVQKRNMRVWTPVFFRAQKSSGRSMRKECWCCGE
jgi:hypothetical protein